MFKSLTSDFNRQFYLKLEFVNVPPSINLLSETEDSAIVTLSGNGWEFLSGEMFTSIETLTIDLSFLKGHKPGTVSVALAPFVKSLLEVPQARVRFVRVFPDSVRFSFTGNFSKWVKIQPDYSVTFKGQFIQSEPVTVVPDSIELFGDEGKLMLIDTVFTTKVNLVSVSNSVDTAISLQIPAGFRTSLKNQQVQMQLPVSEYVEKIFPVQVRPVADEPEELHFIPSEVSLTCRIPINRTQSITANDFVVVGIPSSGSRKSYARIEVQKQPPNLEVFSIYPSFVEAYFIR